MKSMGIRTALFALALALAGCAGTNFVRPTEDSLQLGKTTLGEVQARYGAPRSSGSIMKNDQTVRTASYAYASTMGSPLHEGVTPARAMGLYFHDDRLVGYEFISSWKEDHTDFDEKHVKDLAKGKTTRQQVVQMIGKPSGRYIYPMIKSTTGDGAVYAFVETRGFTHSRKVLIVTYDASGVVTDVEYSSSN